MKRKQILILILFSIGIKFSYLLIPVIVNQSGSDKPFYDQYISSVKKNDSHWYEKIAENGYSEISNIRDLGYSEGADFKQSEWAFFPFYPALNALTSKVFGLSFNNSALIWSLIFSALAIIGLYWFGLIFFKDRSLAFFNALILFSFPFSFYYSMFYTEALFFTFMIYGFICIHYKRYVLLALLLIPLTLLRPNGIFILIPMYLFFLERNGILQNLRIDWRKLFGSNNIIHSIAFISAPIVFLAYGYYQYKMTGYFFAFSIAQDGWYRELTFPLLSFFRKGDLATQYNSIFTIVVIIYAVGVWKKLPLSLNVLVLIGLLLPLCSGSVTSMTRFVSVLFPLFLILSASIHRLKYKYVFLLIILALHFLSYYSWTINHPIGF